MEPQGSNKASSFAKPTLRNPQRCFHIFWLNNTEPEFTTRVGLCWLHCLARLSLSGSSATVLKSHRNPREARHRRPVTEVRADSSSEVLSVLGKPSRTTQSNSSNPSPLIQTHEMEQRGKGGRQFRLTQSGWQLQY